MAIETTGKTFNLFYRDDVWWGDATLEDEIIYVNGVRVHSFGPEDIPEDAIVRIEGGCVEGHPQPKDVGLVEFFELWFQKEFNHPPKSDQPEMTPLPANEDKETLIREVLKQLSIRLEVTQSYPVPPRLRASLILGGEEISADTLSFVELGLPEPHRR